MTKEDAFCGTSVTFTVYNFLYKILTFLQFFYESSHFCIIVLIIYLNVSPFQHCWVYDKVDKNCEPVVVYFIFPMKCCPVVRALPSMQFFDLVSSLGMCRSFI